MFRYRNFPYRLFGQLIAIFLCGGGSVSAKEDLDRAAIAFPVADGRIYIGWRLLASDPSDVVFDVFRRDTPDGEALKLNMLPIDTSTNFMDETAAGGDFVYEVVASSASTNAVRYPLSKVQIGEAVDVGGLSRVKLAGDYSAVRVGLADFDGDGALDFLIKQPGVNIDPSQPPWGGWRPSPDTFKLEAYRSDGSFIWRHNLGWSIELGIWYSPVVAYDVDGDGKAEVYAKAGEGDPRDSTGHVTSGPEYLIKLDGGTGEVLAQIDWPSREGIIDDRKGNGELRYSYYSRNQMGLAFLDGRRPHLLLERGTYTNIKFDAYDPDLRRMWQFEAVDEYRNYRGQGAHGMQIIDLDGDGRDEIIYGAAALDDNGKPLWTTGRGHPDVCYAGDIDPDRPGLEVFYGHEWPQSDAGMCLVDARTGETIWKHEAPTTHIHSEGMVADIDPAHPGMECYGGEKGNRGQWLYSAQGELLSTDRMGGLEPKAAFWSDSPTKSLVGASVEGSPYTWTGEVPGDLIAVVDCLGDWREELIVSVKGEVRIYSTTIPATTRRVTLMQDRRYRIGVGLQTMGYYYPPIVGNQLLPDLSH